MASAVTKVSAVRIAASTYQPSCRRSRPEARRKRTTSDAIERQRMIASQTTRMPFVQAGSRPTGLWTVRTGRACRRVIGWTMTRDDQDRDRRPQQRAEARRRRPTRREELQEQGVERREGGADHPRRDPRDPVGAGRPVRDHRLCEVAHDELGARDAREEQQQPGDRVARLARDDHRPRSARRSGANAISTNTAQCGDGPAWMCVPTEITTAASSTRRVDRERECQPCRCRSHLSILRAFGARRHGTSVPTWPGGRARCA